MPRDYKHRANPGRRRTPPPARRTLGILPFLSGLSLGLFVAFVIYLHEHDAVQSADKPVVANAPPQAGGRSGVPASHKSNKPHFDFYTILPEREVKVPEWEIDKQGQTTGKAIPATSYLLQVGSFQRYEEADRAKAKLALLGIKAGIQRVVINGQDVWFRVRIGPFKKLQALNSTRAKLAANGMNAMLLRIKPEAD